MMNAVQFKNRSNKHEITGFTLHIFAMAFMLLDHMHATISSNQFWMTCIGRLAFPIFAFMIVEGYFHTRDLKKYVIRLLIFAFVSEIPFNMVAAGGTIWPFHQNVLWTFLLGIGCIYLLEHSKKRGNILLQIITAIIVFTAAYVLGNLLMVDYHAAGVFTVLVFYLFRGREWYHYLGQLIGLYYINFDMLGGLIYIFEVFGKEIQFPIQGLAVLALIPIWLYRGKQGKHSKKIQYFYYMFYPVHLLVLGVLAMLM